MSPTPELSNWLAIHDIRFAPSTALNLRIRSDSDRCPAGRKQRRNLCLTLCSGRNQEMAA